MPQNQPTLDFINNFVSKMSGEKDKMLAKLLEATLEGKKLVLIQQDMSSPKELKYQFHFEEAEPPQLPLKSDPLGFVYHLIGRLSTLPEFAGMYPDEVWETLEAEFEAAKDDKYGD